MVWLPGSRMLHRQLRLRQRWDDLPLRKKLALSVWLAVLPISIVSSLVGYRYAHETVVHRLRQQLVWNAGQASAYLSFWESNHLHNLRLFSSIDDVRSLNPLTVRPMVQEMVALFPKYGYAISSTNGRLLVQEGALQLPLKPSQFTGLMKVPTNPVAKAARGIGSSAIIVPPVVSTPCVLSSVPVYQLNERRPPGMAQKVSRPVVGVVSTCLPLDQLGKLTGINTLVRAATNARKSLPIIDFDERKPYGYALLVVFGKDSFLVLGDEGDIRHTAERYDPHSRSKASPAWDPLVRLAGASKKLVSFNQIRIQNIDYFVGIDRRKPGRAVLMVVDQRSAMTPIDELFSWIWIGNLIALAISSIAIYRICGGLAKPIDQAGQALFRISRGEFGAPLPTNQSDVGRLFDYVNQASDQLQAYLLASRQHAITDAQIEEARRIQSDFLIQELPSSPLVELAALFKPAYQIGADWYDAIELDGITFLVVADVCDKGIPSALYMSVFRSLLRLSLEKEWRQCGDVATTLCQSITTVNEYMAETHGATGMFATAFLAAVDPGAARLMHVVAGHESPLLQVGDSITALPVGGPAVGLFQGARFTTTGCPFPAGALLLAFSDGLPDARDPEGSRFGDQRVHALLKEHSSHAWSAEVLVERLEEAVVDYMAGADPFDDLTLLVAKRPELKD